MSKALFLILAIALGTGLMQSRDTDASITRPATSPTVLTDVHTRRESGVGLVAAPRGHYETKCNGSSCQRVWVPDEPTLAGPIKRATFSPTASRQRSIVVRRSRGCRSCR